MALTRKMLSAMGIEDEKIDQIVKEHSEVVNAIKEERDALKADAETAKTAKAEVDRLTKELDAAKAEIAAADVEGLTKKYDDLKAEYDSYKKDTEAKATHATKSELYRELLLQAGVAEKRIASVLKVSDVDGIEIGEDGKIKDADKLIESVKAEWSDFIQTQGTQGANTSNPPANTGGNSFEKMSLADKMKFANEHPDDAGVKAWLEN